MNSNTFILSEPQVQYKSLNEIPVSGASNYGTTENEVVYTEYSADRTKDSDNCIQNGPVSVFDVAKYILKKLGEPCSTMKLHKLLYYCQAWNLVWDETPLFTQPIEAWANGPVIRQLFNFHRGLYQLNYADLAIGNEDILSAKQKENIDEVLDFYGKKSAHWLIDQTHIEKPWQDARKGLASNERGDVVITLDAMQEYYSSLT